MSSDLDGKTRLTNAARAGDCDETYVGARKQIASGFGFLFAADEAIAPHRERRSSLLDLVGGTFVEALANSSEFTRQLAGCGEAPRRILLQATLDGPAEWSGSVALRRNDRLVRLAHDGDKGFRSGASIEGTPASDKFVEDEPKRKLVGTEVCVQPFGLLRRHIVDGAKQDPGCRERIVDGGKVSVAFAGRTRVCELRQTEV